MDVSKVICSICNKTYSSRKTLLNHRREIHNVSEKEKRTKIDKPGCYPCKMCDKRYTSAQSRWRHEKTCKPIVEICNVKMQQEVDLLKKQIIELQNKLLNTNRLDNKTFRAINKILMDRSYRNSHNTINSHNTVNHNNTYQILELGGEELTNVLTFQQKWQIMESRLCSIEKLVEIAHCGEMNQFKNILITNLKDNFAYKYDDSKGYFIAVSKADLLEDVVNNRMMDIEAIYDELKTANKIGERTKKLIQDFLDRMNNEQTPFYDNETKYENFKTFKTDRIKILLYNNHDKITKDIALLISPAENRVDGS